MTQRTEAVDQVYRERSQRFAEMQRQCASRSRWVANIRLVLFLAAGLSILRLLDPSAWIGATWFAAAATLSLAFLALVLFHNALKARCRWYEDLSKLNEEGLARRARDWAALPERDAVAPTPEHPYAEDLDLFGNESLFALLGTVATQPGRRTLRAWLLEPADPDTIRERQAAVAELAVLTDEREEITVRGRMMPEESPDRVATFLAWAEDEPWLGRLRLLVWSARLLSIVPAVLIALDLADIVPYTGWVLALIVNLAFTYLAGGGRIHKTFGRAFTRESSVQQYAELFRLLSSTAFQTQALQRIGSLLATGAISPYRQMRRLHRLNALSEVRFSMPYVAIQALTLWDFHVMLLLEKWQSTAGRQVRSWLSALGEADALAALAALHFDNPEWAFPEVSTEKDSMVEAEGLGHPLLADDVRIANDVKVGPQAKFTLITGSNMSGKSTLLRAIGTNVVLARAGGPVCATSMRMPPLILETSMRIRDSLQQGLSHFMAELERLKGVVDTARRAATDRGSTLLYLLDDIFQGTNSAERQIAARKVITYLLETPAIGAVTSHDLELAETKELSAACVPVHFSETIEDGPEGRRITFDYKLRPGIATSSNALKLLEIVGLDSAD
jgi:hypothetical protein